MIGRCELESVHDCVCTKVTQLQFHSSLWTLRIVIDCVTQWNNSVPQLRQSTRTIVFESGTKAQLILNRYNPDLCNCRNPDCTIVSKFTKHKVPVYTKLCQSCNTIEQDLQSVVSRHRTIHPCVTMTTTTLAAKFDVPD